MQTWSSCSAVFQTKFQNGEDMWNDCWCQARWLAYLRNCWSHGRRTTVSRLCREWCEKLSAWQEHSGCCDATCMQIKWFPVQFAWFTKLRSNFETRHCSSNINRYSATALFILYLKCFQKLFSGVFRWKLCEWSVTLLYFAKTSAAQSTQSGADYMADVHCTC